jgi:hypothetical protein
MAGSRFSTRTLRRQFAADVNAAASRAASAYPGREAGAGPASAFWIALGQVARGQPGGSGRRWAVSLADLGRRAGQVARGLLSGPWRALRRIIPGRQAATPRPVGGRHSVLYR